MQIKSQPGGNLTDADRLELAKLLVKAGYGVRIHTEKTGTKTAKVIELTQEEKER